MVSVRVSAILVAFYSSVAGLVRDLREDQLVPL